MFVLTLYVRYFSRYLGTYRHTYRKFNFEIQEKIRINDYFMFEFTFKSKRYNEMLNPVCGRVRVLRTTHTYTQASRVDICRLHTLFL